MTIKTIKEAIEQYGEEIYDIVHNSPSKSIAYIRGLAIGGPTLATLCAIWWNYNNTDNNNEWNSPCSGMLLLK